MKEILFSVEFWKIVVPLIIAIYVWYMNERQKLIWEQYKRKEENYRKLMYYLGGFYTNTKNVNELKAKFISQVKLCWLYCPDKVINQLCDFLEKVNSKPFCQEITNKAEGDLIVEIRKDLLSQKKNKKTSLSHNDFNRFRLQINQEKT